jgi:hypothetical protein
MFSPQKLSKVILKLTLVLVLCLAFLGQASSQKSAPVTIAADAIEESYCRTDSQSFEVHIKLKLEFSNSSNRNVILARAIQNPVIVRLAKSRFAAQAGAWEKNSNPDFVPGKLPAAPHFGGSPDPKVFVTLAPGQTYDTTVESHVVGEFDPLLASREGGVAPNGNYVFDVGIATWPYRWPYFSSRVNAEELRNRWQARGTLATDFVYSDLVALSIPMQFDDPQCVAKTSR